MAESLSSMDETNSEASDRVEIYVTELSDSSSIRHKLTSLLEIDEEVQSDITEKLLVKGQQALSLYKDNIISEIYEEQMNGNSELLQILKAYHRNKWETEYASKFLWFRTLIKESENDIEALYDQVLTRTAEHGNKYMKDHPLLSLVIQLLFESLCDDDMSAVFNDIWNSLTYDELRSITRYSNYIIPEIMKKQLDRNSENKLNGHLFMALREYYRNPLVQHLTLNAVRNRRNLYELALNSVAERGSLNGVKMTEKKTTKMSFDNLMGSINEVPNPTLDSTLNPLLDPIIPHGKLIYHKKETKRSYQDDWGRDLSNILSCAEKSTVQLLAYFEEMLAGDLSHLQEDNVIKSLLEQLIDQIKKEELFSEQIQESFRDLGRHIDNHDAPSMVRFLRKLLTNIRPMHLQEILGLVEIAKDTAKLIHGKDIILLVGETGSRKSTIIQFLAGCKMTKIKVESEPGKSLEHIVVTGPINNP